MNLFIMLACGLALAIIAPKGAMLTAEGQLLTTFAASFVGWFLLGSWLGTAIRLLPPRTAHVITFLGTAVIQTIKTGISLTLPWPFGWTHAVVSLAVASRPFKVQIKGEDELVYDLPGSIQFEVMDAARYSTVRDKPIEQMDQVVIPVIRSTGNTLGFKAVYGDKGAFMEAVSREAAEKLAGFGLRIVDIPIQDPELRASTVEKLNAIREAQFDEQAAKHNANAIFERMTGEARAEAESLRLKAVAFQAARLLAAEGNAAAIAVMQGKLGIVWEDQAVGEGDLAKTIKVPKFVAPNDERLGQNVQIPEIDISPQDVLAFLRIIDSNDAIRDAAAKPGTVIVVPSGGGQDFGNIAALTQALNVRGHYANGAAHSSQAAT